MMKSVVKPIQTSPKLPDNRQAWPLLAAVGAMVLQACTVGPDYVRPTAPAPAAFKEAAPGGVRWVPGKPGDLAERGPWWAVFNDPLLDQLERRVAVDNFNLRAAEAAYRQSVELISQSRAGAYPTVGLNGSGDRSGSGGGGGGGGSATSTTTSSGAIVNTGAGGGVRDNFRLSGSASWTPDLWGRIRRTVQSDRATAQASAADLAGARLSAQSALASNYLEIRVIDQQRTLYDTTLAAYRRALTLTQNRYNAGVVARADVITAETQLRSVEATALDLGVRRGQLEHAIANLIGVAPAELTIAPVATADFDAPDAPLGLPSTLLERRPDIAAAERRVAAANAEIGIATAAYYPNLSLSADGGFSAATLGSLIGTASSFWSLGTGLGQSVIDFGARRARVRQTRARYDQAVAQYRQVTLDAFTGVEDQLVALRVLRQEAGVRTQAEALARRAEEIALNRYRSGLVDYNTVITAQAQSLSASQSTLAVRRARLLASVGLIEALGGGWTTAELPNPKGRIGFP